MVTLEKDKIVIEITASEPVQEYSMYVKALYNMLDCYVRQKHVNNTQNEEAVIALLEEMQIKPDQLEKLLLK